MATVLTYFETTCSRCGAETWWYQELGPDPLCESCWDDDTGGLTSNAKVGIEPLLAPPELAANQRAYRQAHKAAAAANQRAYRQAHKAEYAAHQRAYNQAHKAEPAVH